MPMLSDQERRAGQIIDSIYAYSMKAPTTIWSRKRVNQSHPKSLKMPWLGSRMELLSAKLQRI